MTWLLIYTRVTSGPSQPCRWSLCARWERHFGRASTSERERERARERERRDAHTNCTGARVDNGEANISAGNFSVALQVSRDFFFFRKLSFCTKGFGRLICENGLASRKTVRCLLPASLLCASAVVDFIFIFFWEKEVARLPGRCWNFRNPCRLIFGERLFLVRIVVMCLHCNSFVFW